MSLSVGVELEGVATEVLVSPEALLVEDFEKLKLIAEALKKRGLDAYVYDPSDDDKDYSKWGVTFDETIYEQTSGSDTIISGSQNRFGFELVSPAGLYDKPKEWNNEMKKALDAVSDVVKWKANRSCGLHVHVGSCVGLTGSKFSLEHIQKVAMFCCRFEAALDDLHQDHRSSEANEDVKSNRNNRVTKSLDIAQIYEQIEGAQDEKHVCRIIQVDPDDKGDDLVVGPAVHRGFKVNLLNLGSTGTIEFRQHAGTTDVDVVCRWVRYVVKLVEFARDNSFEKIKEPGDKKEDLEKCIGSL